MIKKLYLTDLEFKKLKKSKKSIFIILNNNELKDLKIKDKIYIIDSDNHKKHLKRKIKNIYDNEFLKQRYKDINKKKLGYKKGDKITYDLLVNKYNDEDIKKNGIIGIEVNLKHHVIRKIVVSILSILLILILLFIVNLKISELNGQRYRKIIGNIEKDKNTCVFVEINPSLVLTIKNDKIDNFACLNKDCLTIYDKLNIVDENINNGLNIIYNVVKENGFDISNGINIKTTIDINIEPKDYIMIEYINQKEEDMLLENVINNDEIKSVNNYNYYNILWNKLKKDRDYDKVYTCNMSDNELECYFIVTAIEPHKIIVDDNSKKNITNVFDMIYKRQKISETLTKFNIENTNNPKGILTVNIDGIIYNYIEDGIVGYSIVGPSSMTTAENGIIVDTTYYDNSLAENHEINLKMGLYNDNNLSYLYLKDLNLVSPNKSLNKLNIIE